MAKAVAAVRLKAAYLSKGTKRYLRAQQKSVTLDAANAVGRTDPARTEQHEVVELPAVRREAGPELRGEGGVTEGTRTPDLRDHNPTL
jgi:hypothetical protein